MLLLLLFRTEQVEREGILRTRAMRERDEVRMAVRHYRFVLLRVRMPDGYILQGKTGCVDDPLPVLPKCEVLSQHALTVCV